MERGDPDERTVRNEEVGPVAPCMKEVDGEEEDKEVVEVVEVVEEQKPERRAERQGRAAPRVRHPRGRRRRGAEQDDDAADGGERVAQCVRSRGPAVVLAAQEARVAQRGVAAVVEGHRRDCWLTDCKDLVR